LKERSFAIFVVSAFLISIPLAFYFSFAPPFLGDMNMPNVTGATVLGQISEIFFLLVMPWFFVRLGVKYMLMVGMFSWGARYLLFLLGFETEVLWPLYLGIILHGICYDFFFVTAYIYVDKKASGAIRAKAQGLIALVTLGAGMFVGTTLSGVIAQRYSFPQVETARFQEVTDARSWAVGNYAGWETDGEMVLGEIQSIVTDGSALPGITPPLVGTTNAPASTVEVYRQGDSGFEPSGVVQGQPLAALSKPIRRWDKIWLIPAIGALGIMGLFAALFRYRQEVRPESASDAHEA
jgi:MFS family permease